MKIDVICTQCKKTFQRSKRDINNNKKRNRKNYCSLECRNQAALKGTYIPCANCQKQAYKKISTVARSLTGLTFCNRSCSISFNNRSRVGENHSRFIRGETLYRDIALNHYGCKCMICGYDNKRILQVHHKDFNHTNNYLENLEVLCRNHHAEKHLKN